MTMQHIVADGPFGLVSRRCWEIQRRVLEGTLNPNEVADDLQLVMERRFSGQSFLRLISGSENLTIDSVDGSETLVEANDVFAYIDPDFQNWKADETGVTTVETSVRVYEMVKDATFAQMFGSLSEDAEKLCFTQAQIKGFVRKHCQWLRSDGYATFFLFRSHNHFFVARVRVASGGGLLVGVDRFEHSVVWHAGNLHRVVVPQLA
ncbi:MAG: hypothetical protein A2731_01585 [Candidatus Buchananbacteria bacterium RIFCSPHIGHO2_01_FULL_39_8]|uniref:Uncharacterized protein n=1 Tax=Candidatus Buchananbacteria bacterium RIFCSPHIGHO2_01_FULL_39_8 TaxID=1797533 RepID=A0A1G1Y2U8_9BACT|nr:hypothetical protein [uncultured bacterium]OGY46146.1 MAG: hypothetical protein A2731_01585 [Candidatus Buchananbacteria bacterium RIFCSPHIGHO2_01_FULL_39_8]